MVVVTTRDGRTHTGNLVAENDRQITLRVVGRDPVAINKADIQSRETTATSMMPPGLFDALSEREVDSISSAIFGQPKQVKARATTMRPPSFLTIALARAHSLCGSAANAHSLRRRLPSRSDFSFTNIAE